MMPCALIVDQYANGSVGIGVFFFQTFQCGDLLTEWMFECNKMVLFNVNSWEKYMTIYLLR